MTLRLNNLRPSQGAKRARKRVGRGIGSTLGKTAGRGHKGQKSRAGGFTKVGFEGGQMPLQRRIPKMGFTSRKAMITAEIRLHELRKIAGEVINMASLKEAKLIKGRIKRVKIIASGEIDKAVIVQGIPVTRGAKAAIEAAGGKVE